MNFWTSLHHLNQTEIHTLLRKVCSIAALSSKLWKGSRERSATLTQRDVSAYWLLSCKVLFVPQPFKFLYRFSTNITLVGFSFDVVASAQKPELMFGTAWAYQAFERLCRARAEVG
jgi:hypothetical protein